MKYFIMLAVISLTSLSAYAKKNCTGESKDQWISEEVFKQKAKDLGYKIRKFKQPGSCYEIYGTNKDGKKVEVYFNPVDMSVVKEKIK